VGSDEFFRVFCTSLKTTRSRPVPPSSVHSPNAWWVDGGRRWRQKALGIFATISGARATLRAFPRWHAQFFPLFACRLRARFEVACARLWIGCSALWPGGPRSVMILPAYPVAGFNPGPARAVVINWLNNPSEGGGPLDCPGPCPVGLPRRSAASGCTIVDPRSR